MDDRGRAFHYASFMLDYARQRALEILKIPSRAVFVTSGPAGVHASMFPCEASGLDLYILIPSASDHIFNLEHEHDVTLLTDVWELKGQAQIMSPGRQNIELDLLHEQGVEWCMLVRVEPSRLQIRNQKGWGYQETIDLTPSLQE
jgi:hypothetical protein